MGDNVGTLRSVMIGGNTYDAAGDVDLSVFMTDFEIEGIATSGKPVFKYTKRTQNAQNVTLILTSDQLGELRLFAASTSDIMFSFETQNGNSFQSTGRISLGEWTSAESRCDVTMIPSDPWAIF